MQLVTISPVHIGDGNELTFFEYIQENGNLKVYPFSYLIDKILETCKDLQKLQLIMSTLKVKAKEGLKGGLKDFFKETRIDSITPKYELSSKVEGLNGNIKTFIKTLEGPYIPGSEIKGALRTVFMYGILKKDEDLKNELYRELENIAKENKKLEYIKNPEEKKKKKKKLVDSLEKILSDNIEIKIFRNKEKDAQYDLFKALIISDSQPISFEDFYVGCIKVLNSSRNLQEHAEILKEGTKIPLSCKVEKKVALNGLKKLSLFDKHENKNIKKLTWEFLKDSAIEFYLDLIENEKNYVERYVKEETVKNSLEEQLKKIRSYILGFQNSSKLLIPLRIGKHQGYLSLTIMQLVKKEKEKPGLFEDVFKLSISKVRTELNKTRKILEVNGKHKFLGWCVLEIKEA